MWKSIRKRRYIQNSRYFKDSDSISKIIPSKNPSQFDILVSFHTSSSSAVVASVKWNKTEEGYILEPEALRITCMPNCFYLPAVVISWSFLLIRWATEGKQPLCPNKLRCRVVELEPAAHKYCFCSTGWFPVLCAFTERDQLWNIGALKATRNGKSDFTHTS